LKKLERMDRTVLADKIASFCFDYHIIDLSKAQMIEVINQIESKLDEVEFVENLINIIFTKIRQHRNTNLEKAKELFLELDAIRWDLEFKDYNKKII